MQSPETLVQRDIVLIGGGHSHVVVLRRFAMRPEPGVRLTVICNTTDTPYSGMLPGYIAGHYTFDEVHIDLARLARFAGARFYRDEVTGIDRDAKRVLCRDHPPVAYDVCSINIGSTPQVDRVPGAAGHVVPVKPIRAFNERWLALLERVRAHSGRTTIAVVGSGAGGVELTLAMQYRLRAEARRLGRDPDELEFHLFARDAVILATHNAWVRRHFMRVLEARGVHVHTRAEVLEVDGRRLRTAGGEAYEADEIVWVTQAGGAAWLASTGLALDDAGFVRVNAGLQSVTDPDLFAAGDIAAFGPRPLEKAGVFAVRMGRPLADNLRRRVRGEAPRPWRPQRHWLALISTGDRHTVASRGPIGFAGAWVWTWKDWIDRRFMRRFGEFPPMSGQPAVSAASRLALTPEESTQAISALAMRCGGCGAKVGASVLARALAGVKPVDRPEVVIGLDAPDDAAVVRVPPGKALVQTVDFFRAFVDDPFVFGQVAANHALGDIYAMGASPQTATAVVTVPPGLDAKVEDLLFQLMSGAVAVLNAANCALVGGHSGEGAELALGFAVTGLVDDVPGSSLTKRGLRPGDALVLTKPVGTGTLFVAHNHLAAKGRWIDGAIASMLQSSARAADILRLHGAHACTDVTGFGVLGHLVEMARASGVDVEVSLDALPLLDGAGQCAAAGFTSSLQPANVRLRRAIRNQEGFASHPRYPLIFDPQTAGGLLAAVPADRAGACLTALRDAGYAKADVIGHVRAAGDAVEPVVLLP